MRLYKSQPPAILKKLTIDEATWIETVSSFTAQFHAFVGPEEPYPGFVKNKAKNGLKVSAYADNYLLHQGFVRRKSFITQLFFFYHTEFSVDISMFRKYKTS